MEHTLLQTLFNMVYVNVILKIPLSSHNYCSNPDKINWLHHSTRNFSVKSTYPAMIKPQISPQMLEMKDTYKDYGSLRFKID